MKTNTLRLLAFLLGMSVIVSSCKKEETQNPATLAEFTISNDNATATAVFSEAVYKLSNKTGNLDATSFDLSITGGAATLTSFTVTHTAGTASVAFALKLAGVANGQEVLKVTPKTATSIYNGAGVATATAQTKTVNLKETGIIGRWYSSKTNVAVLLRTYFSIDSLYANFKLDNTYIVESFTVAGSKTTMTGTYIQTKSAVTGIWDITVNQTTPSTLTSKGIFQLFPGTNVTMKYEIAQTDPVAAGVTPPTAAGGFGSTNGGALGTINVQTYIRMQ